MRSESCSIIIRGVRLVV